MTDLLPAAAQSENEPVAWRYRLKGWSKLYWHYFTKEPRYRENDEIWQALYIRPSGRTAVDIETIQRENEHLTKSGIIEVSVRNPNVAEYMVHWEERATAAEARCAKLARALHEAKTRMRNARGAVESNQVIDKDVRGTLARGIMEIEAALRPTTEETR